MEPRFYLSSKTNKEGRSSVMLYISIHGKRITISTGKYIKPDNWNERTQRARGDSKVALEFNIFLISFGAKAIAILSSLIENQEPEIIKKLKEQIKAAEKIKKNKAANDLHGKNGSLLTFVENYQKTAPKSKGTKGQYLTTLNLLKEFQDTTFHKPIDFESVDMPFYDQLITFFQDEKKYAVNTIGKYIKNLKFFMGEAEENDLHSNLKFKSKKFKKPTEESFSIYLTEKEIEQMFKHDFSEAPVKEMVRDLFVASCWIGVRIGDLLSIRKENIGANQISIRTIKTNEFVDIPLHPIVKDILSKYEGSFPNNISEQKFNEKLKEIAADVGLSDQIGYSITKGGMKKKITEAKHQLISAHTARRSFATNLYKRGLPIQTIMAVTGHQTEKSFRTYIKSKRIDAVKDMSGFFQE
jgi:integrase